MMTVTGQISSPLDPSLTWSENQTIGISTSYGQYDATARNRAYVCQSDGMSFLQTTGYPIYVKGSTSIVAYYPFKGIDGAEPSLELDTRDQSQVNDYLFAKTEGVTRENGGKVNLVFNYALARLVLNIVAPEGEQITSYRLSGFALQATVDPYTLAYTLDNPVDLVGQGTDIRTITLKLIPQSTGGEGSVPAKLVLIGKIRSYTIDMSELTLTAGTETAAQIDVTTGVGNLEFISGGATWSDSGIGGQVSSK